MANTNRPQPHADDVIEASEESFPASDPPAFVSTTGSSVKNHGRNASKPDATDKNSPNSEKAEPERGSRKGRP